MMAARQSLLAALAVAWIGAASAGALQIDGLPVTEPLVARTVQPQLERQQLTLPFTDGATVRIQPWPSYLPQRFGLQSASGYLRQKPAGPVSQLELTAVNEKRPWLVIAHGTRANSTLYGDWRLVLEDGHWFAQQAEHRIRLEIDTGHSSKTARARQLAVDGVAWCFYLLDARAPTMAGTARSHEQEPQIDWVMVRQEKNSRCCWRRY